MSYASVQAIRESAGLLSRVNNETAKGVVDGANRNFVVARRPIVDGNYDDVVDVEDVHVFVAGIPVTVTNVDAATGQVTLQTAPTTGQKVTVDYQFSPITDDFVRGKQEEADSWVNLKLKTTDIKPPLTLPLNPVPGVICTAAEMYAAGLILTRDYGSRVDSEQTSKDGFAKIKQARELIADYIAGIVADKQYQNRTLFNQVDVAADNDVFDRDLRTDGARDPEEYFMRRDWN